MDFRVKRLDWIRIGDGKWVWIDIGEHKLKMVKEIRI